MINVSPAADGSIGCQVRSFFYPSRSRPSYAECTNRAFYVAKRDIARGEELYVDYIDAEDD